MFADERDDFFFPSRLLDSRRGRRSRRSSLPLCLPFLCCSSALLRPRVLLLVLLFLRFRARVGGSEPDVPAGVARRWSRSRRFRSRLRRRPLRPPRPLLPEATPSPPPPPQALLLPRPHHRSPRSSPSAALSRPSRSRGPPSATLRFCTMPRPRRRLESGSRGPPSRARRPRRERGLMALRERGKKNAEQLLQKPKTFQNCFSTVFFSLLSQLFLRWAKKPHPSSSRLSSLSNFHLRVLFDRLLRSNACPGGCWPGAERGKRAIRPPRKTGRPFFLGSALHHHHQRRPQPNGSKSPIGLDDPARPRRLLAPAAGRALRRLLFGAESGPGAVDGAVCTEIGRNERRI